MHIEGVSNYRPIYQEISEKATELGVLLQGTNGGQVLRFLPDYLITEGDMDVCLDVLEKIL